jgi:hypothetical protein
VAAGYGKTTLPLQLQLLLLLLFLLYEACCHGTWALNHPEHS